MGADLGPQRRAIQAAVMNFVRMSPDISALVGEIRDARIADVVTQSMRRQGGPPIVVQGYLDVWVTGDGGTDVVKVYWTMDQAGRVTVTHFQPA